MDNRHNKRLAFSHSPENRTHSYLSFSSFSIHVNIYLLAHQPPKKKKEVESLNLSIYIGVYKTSHSNFCLRWVTSSSKPLSPFRWPLLVTLPKLSLGCWIMHTLLHLANRKRCWTVSIRLSSERWIFWWLIYSQSCIICLQYYTNIFIFIVLITMPWLIWSLSDVAFPQ